MSKSPYKLPIIYVFIVLLFSGLSSCSNETQPYTFIFVLLDTSGSWKLRHSDHDNSGEFVFRRVNEAILESINQLPKPIYYYVIKISSDSLREDPFCAFAYKERPLIKMNTGDGIDDKKKLRAVLSACEMATNKLDVTQYTDITGALRLVSQMSRNSSISEKKAIIISDMKEELKPNRSKFAAKQAEKLPLDDFHIAVIYSILPNNEGISSDQYPIDWKSRLKASGADVTLIHEDSPVEDEIKRFLLFK